VPVARIRVRTLLAWRYLLLGRLRSGSTLNCSRVQSAPGARAAVAITVSEAEVPSASPFFEIALDDSHLIGHMGEAQDRFCGGRWRNAYSPAASIFNRENVARCDSARWRQRVSRETAHRSSSWRRGASAGRAARKTPSSRLGPAASSASANSAGGR